MSIPTRPRRAKASTYVVLAVVALAALLAVGTAVATGDLTALFQGIGNGLTSHQAHRNF